jgi:hypothetical protein
MKALEANQSEHVSSRAPACDLFASGRQGGSSFGTYTETVLLPGGYVDDYGAVHREVELAAMNGFDEEFLACIDSRTRSACAVSALLARCVRRVGAMEPAPISLIRNLLVGDRDFLMLKLREMTFGKRLDAVLYCGQPSCGKPMDVTLNLDDFAPDPKPVDRRIFTLALSTGQSETGDLSIDFRLPTGADQEAAGILAGVDDDTAVTRLLAHTILRINGKTSIEDQDVRSLATGVQREIERQMEELAPQVPIELDTSCVECKQPFSTPFDLPSFFFAELRQGLRYLEREIHFLALHYHWPESEILALTRRKRRRYIELIREESLGTFVADTQRIAAAS